MDKRIVVKLLLLENNAVWKDGKACGQIFSVKCIGATNLSQNGYFIAQVYVEIPQQQPF